MRRMFWTPLYTRKFPVLSLTLSSATCFKGSFLPNEDTSSETFPELWTAFWAFSARHYAVNLYPYCIYLYPWLTYYR